MLARIARRNGLLATTALIPAFTALATASLFAVPDAAFAQATLPVGKGGDGGGGGGAGGEPNLDLGGAGGSGGDGTAPGSGGGGGGGGDNGGSGGAGAGTGGGAGGIGGSGSTGQAASGGNATVDGSGGGGGAGGGSNILTITNTAISGSSIVIAGQAGGNGGAGLGSGSGGGGGAGGIGTAYGQGNFSLTTTTGATVVAAAGGAGGNGGLTGNGGNGGEGGSTAIIRLTGTTTVNTRNNLIGGQGGNGGAGVVQGNGGNGGPGHIFSGVTLFNHGSYTGGNGGTGLIAGSGGAGILGSDVTIDNLGTISGGLSGDGITRGLALQLSGTNTITNIGTLVGGVEITSGTTTFDIATDQTLANVVSGAGALTKAGNGTLTLSGSNTYTGQTTVAAGTLLVTNVAGLGSSASGTTVLDGATLAFSNTGRFDITDIVTINGNGVNGEGALQARGVDVVIANSLVLGSDSRVSVTSGVMTINAIAGSGHSLEIDGPGTLLINGNMAIGTGTLTKNGTGITLLARTTDFTGDTIVNAGVLQLNALNTLANQAIGDLANLVINGGEVEIGNDETVGSLRGATGALLSGSSTRTLTVGGNNQSTTFAGSISGGLNVTKTGTGTLTLSGNSTTSGTIRVAEGTLALGANEAGSNNSLLEIAGGTFAMGSFTDTVRRIDLSTGSITGGLGSRLDVIGDYVQSGGTLEAGVTVNVGTVGRVRLNGGTISGVINGARTAPPAGIVNGLGVVINGTVSVASEFDIGSFGTGGLTISGGGLLRNTSGFIAFGEGSAGTVTVTGAGSRWENSLALRVGANGAGVLMIADSGLVTTGTSATIAANSGSTGTATVTGAGSQLVVGSQLDIGISGTGTLNITNGGFVSTQLRGALGGGFSGGLGIANVTGTGSRWQNAGPITIGRERTGIVTLADGGVMTASGVELGFFPSGNGTLNFGAAADSTAAAPGVLTTPRIAFGAGTGTIVFNHTASDFKLGAGISGNGTLRQLAGTTILTGTNTYSGNTTISGGILQIGDGGTTGTIGSGTVTNNATLVFNRSNDLALLNVISGTGSLIKQGGGALFLLGANTYTGLTSVDAGTLVVTGSLAGAVNVSAGGTLGGTGTIGGAVTVGSGGTLAAGQSPGTLTVGALTLNAGSASIFELGQAGVAGGANNDLIQVTGTLALNGGTIQVVRGSGFTSGQYTLFTYGTLSGALGNMTLDPLGGGFVGSLALGVGSVLLNTASSGDLVWWNGTTTSPTGAIVGGDGIWSLGGANFADADGLVSGPWAGNGSLAVFGGTAGTVTIAPGATVAPSGLNFLTDGYVITGGDAAAGLLLSGPTGIDTATGVVATIAAAITGSGSLTKTGSGTLTLSGVNTYSGATTVLGGTLVNNGTLAGDVTSAAGFVNAGSVAGALGVLAGGTAENLTGAVLSGGATIAAGSTLDNAGAIGGDVSNAGTLTNSGDIAGLVGNSGTLVNSGMLGGGLSNALGGDVRNEGDLAGAIANSGTLTSTGTITGTLTNAAGGTASVSGVLAGAVSNAGRLTLTGATSGIGAVSQEASGVFDLAGNSTAIGSLAGSGTVLLGAATLTSGSNNASTSFAGVISGSGGLTKTGSGTLTLTGANTYAGTTTISGGTLQLGAGGTSGTLGSGAIINNAMLVLNRSDALSLGNAISGSGMLVQDGTGTTTLTGANTYSGGTLVSRGRLVGDTTSLQGGIVNNAVLAFAQGADGTFAGMLGGTGRVEKTGAGTLTFAGDGRALTGPFAVLGGTLRLDGRLDQSVVTLAAGTTLAGNGLIGGLVAESGALVSAGNSIGAIGVTGNVTFSAGSRLLAEVSQSGADLISAGGTARLAGALDVVNIGAAAYRFNTGFDLVTAAGGVTGSFDSVSFTGFDPIYRPVLRTTATGLTLVLAPNSLADLAGNGLSGNQAAVAARIDAAVAAGFDPQAFIDIYNLAPAQLGAALDQLSGEAHAAVGRAAMRQSRLPREAVLERAAGVALAGNPQGTSWGSWGKLMRSWGDVASGDGTAAQQTDTEGFVIGFDGGIANDTRALRVGAYGSYLDTRIAIDARGSSGRIEQAGGGLYASLALGGLSLVAGGGAARFDITTDRTITLPGLADVTTSASRGDMAQLFGRLGYRFDLGAASLEPFVAGDHAWIALDQTTERGGAAALAAGRQEYKVAGATAGIAAKLPLGPLRLDADAAARFELGDRAPQALLALAAAPGQTTRTAASRLAGTAFTGRLGAVLPVTNRIEVRLDYAGEFSTTDTEHTAQAGISIRF